MDAHQLHELRHPRRHLPEILTGKENAARHLLTDIGTAHARAHRILMRPSWGIVEGADEADLAAVTADILEAAVTLLGVLGVRQSVEQVLLDRAYHQYIHVESPTAEVWPMQLSTVLSVITRKMVALNGPPAVEQCLQWMTGDPTIELGTEAADIAADFCAPDLLDQHPALTADLPAVPAVTNDDTTDRITCPKPIVDWVAKVARLIPDIRGDDPYLLVRQLDRDTRRRLQAQISLARGD